MEIVTIMIISSEKLSGFSWECLLGDHTLGDPNIECVQFKPLTLTIKDKML